MCLPCLGPVEWGYSFDRGWIMLSSPTRALLALMAVAYGTMGLVLFVTPETASAAFAWKVSPFVAMTIGGWCLGNAWAAAFALTSRPAAVFGTLIYLALFGLFETAVLVAFRGNLRLATPLAWLYAITLAGTVLFAVAFALDWLRSRPILRRIGRPLTAIEFIGSVLFVVAVGALGIYVLTRPPVTYGRVFPEAISLFTLRSFGALYLAIAIASLCVPIGRGLGNYLGYGAGMYGLIVFVTLAALRFIGVFDFAAWPMQSIYIGAYVVVGAIVGVKIMRYRATAEATA